MGLSRHFSKVVIDCNTSALCFASSLVPAFRTNSILKVVQSTRRYSSRTFLTMNTSTFGGGSGIVIPPQRAPGKQPATIVFLHGLGDTANGWAPAFPIPGLEYAKVVLPTAHHIPVTLNMGMTMPAFFDLYGLEADSRVDEAGIHKGIARIDRIVQEEVSKGVDRNRIVVGGFSQGGALALRYALEEGNVGGVVGLSCWLPGGKDKVGNARRLPKVLMCHGDEDMVVRFKYGKKTADVLKENGADVEFKVFRGMGHSSCPEELQVISKFLQSVLE